MPKRTDIDSILILGAGPIIIGQACEFDYSGAQACKALKEEGYRVILVNSNPATIMTDPNMADSTYIEPIEWQTVARIIEKEKPAVNSLTAFKQILGMIDLTTLSGDDTNERVLNLCTQAKSYFDGNSGIPNVAAVCVYPIFAKKVHQALAGTDIKTASVAGAFPSGQSPLSIRQDEVKYAVDQGAQEIDMVISRGKLIEGDKAFIVHEVSVLKKSCGDAQLKVIL